MTELAHSDQRFCSIKTVRTTPIGGSSILFRSRRGEQCLVCAFIPPPVNTDYEMINLPERSVPIMEWQTPPPYRINQSNPQNVGFVIQPAQIFVPNHGMTDTPLCIDYSTIWIILLFHNMDYSIIPQYGVFYYSTILIIPLFHNIDYSTIPQYVPY